MRTTRLHHLQLAAALLCALTAGTAFGQAAPAAGAPANANPATGSAPANPGSGFLPPASSSAKVVDAVRVVVNDEVITRNEVRNRVAQIVQRLRAQNTQLPPQEDLERQVIEAMIVERAQVQLAKEMGVRVDDRMLDAAIGRIAQEQKMSVQEMRNQMEKEGMAFAAFREEIRNEIMMQRLREHEVDSKIQVSDAEVDTFLAAEKAAAADRIEVDIAQILVGIPANATPEQIAARSARAEEVMRQLRTGADFAKVAATYSDSADALKGGVVGWREADRLPPVFANALRKLSPGQVTPIIKTNIGFYILKLNDKRSLANNTPEQSVVEQTRARHIMMKATPTMSADEVKRRLRNEGQDREQDRDLRGPGAPELAGQQLVHQGRRPGLAVSGRRDAGVRGRDGGHEAGRAVGRGPDPVRLPPDPGPGAQERRRDPAEGTQPRARHHPRAQAGRSLRGLGAPGARPRLRRVSRGAVSPWPRRRQCARPWR